MIKVIKMPRNVIEVLVALSIISSSFDIFLVINLFGFNFRFTQLVMIPVILIWVAGCLNKGEISFPKGMPVLLLWTVIQTFFSFRSPSIKNAVGYDLWLIFDVMMIFAIHYYCDKAFDKKRLMRIYINSFEFVSIIGLLQFILYFFGINFYVTQTWGPRLARINGFSYEPSFYATYLIMGFILSSYLLFYKDETCFKYKELRRKQLIISLALFLSSSRMGWLMMAIWFALETIMELKCLMKTNKVLKKRVWFILLVIVLLGGILVIMYGYVLSHFDLTFLFNGLGFFGTSSHSSSARINGLMLSFKIFNDSPFAGYGLGGVDPITAKYMGVTYSTLNNGYSTSIIGDLLIASGGLAVFIIIVYFCIMIRNSSCRMRIQKALSAALVFELIILCFNQNILRPYFWMHLAVMSAFYKPDRMPLRTVLKLQKKYL